MNNKLANPAPLGLIGFAATTWLLSMINAGWFGKESMPLVLAMALAFGGGAQMLAGLLSYVRGNTFATVAFLSYGAFWLSFVAYVQTFGGSAPPPFVGWYLFVWGLFTFYMWIASFRHNIPSEAIWASFAPVLQPTCPQRKSLIPTTDGWFCQLARVPPDRDPGCRRFC